MSDTPRTDAAEIVLVYPAGSAYQATREVQTSSVPAEFARQLEREVAALREALEFVLSHPELLSAITEIRALLKKGSP